ncbi:MAG: hypothetical protein LBR50_05795 [Tannerella sp.]|jgi:hypothetical protein|nr:hypothetical protein [Tannerella sp.]
MNKKLSFEKALALGIIIVSAFAVFLPGCKDDYDPQFEYINHRIDSVNQQFTALRNELNSRIAQIQSSLSGNYSIKEVQTITTGTGGIRLIMTNPDGQDIQYVIRNGADGATGSVWDIDDYTGNWICDGELTDYRAVGVNGVNAKAPYIRASDSLWVIPQWNATTQTYVDSVTTIKAAGSSGTTMITYATGDTYGNYTLHVVGNDLATWYDIPLYSGKTLQLLGHIRRYQLLTNLSLSEISTDTLKFTASLSGSTVVTSLQSDSVALVISTDASSAALTNLRLKNSKGAVLPLKFGTPVAMSSSGVVTKSLELNGGNTIYYLPLLNETLDSYSTVADFKLNFVSGAVYYLANDLNLTSNYSSWTIVPEP